MACFSCLHDEIMECISQSNFLCPLIRTIFIFPAAVSAVLNPLSSRLPFWMVLFLYGKSQRRHIISQEDRFFAPSLAEKSQSNLFQMAFLKRCALAKKLGQISCQKREKTDSPIHASPLHLPSHYLMHYPARCIFSNTHNSTKVAIFYDNVRICLDPTYPQIP